MKAKFNRPYVLFLVVILFFSFLTRVINLNYNSPFNDEATDIVVGRLGIFQGDWWSYNTSAWLAGFPYIYPPITATASIIGGVVGSRLLNVFIGVLTVEIIFIFTALLSGFKHPYDYIAGLIAAALIGGSSIAFYVNRIATYDTLSFYLLLLGLIPLLQAELPNHSKGRNYFYAAFLILFSCLTKIIVFIYLPLIIIYSFVRAKKSGKDNLRFWIIYFLAPIVIIVSLYGIGNFSTLVTYAKANAARETVDLSVFITMLWSGSSYNWLFWSIGSVGLFVQKRFKLWLILTFCAVWVMIPHFLSQRAHWTFEKQIFLTVLFITPVAAIGITHLIIFLKNRYARIGVSIAFSIVLGMYWIISYVNAQAFNLRWANSNNALMYLSDHVKSGDKVLAESSGTAILALYDKNFPTNTTTFDWFIYHNMQGENAYLSAVLDGYFDMVELEGLGQQGDERKKTLHDDIEKVLKDNYRLTYENNGFSVYKRTF